MSKLDDLDNEQQYPIDLVGVFSRAVNYPRDSAGVQFLAQGLAKAARLTGASMAAIIDRWADGSDRCPTDREMQQTGEAITGHSASAIKAPMGCNKCQGSGWYTFQKELEPIPGAPYMADYARHCACEAGQFLAAAEHKREEQRKARRAGAAV